LHGEDLDIADVSDEVNDLSEVCFSNIEASLRWCNKRKQKKRVKHIDLFIDNYIQNIKLKLVQRNCQHDFTNYVLESVQEMYNQKLLLARNTKLYFDIIIQFMKKGFYENHSKPLINALRSLMNEDTLTLKQANLLRTTANHFLAANESKLVSDMMSPWYSCWINKHAMIENVNLYSYFNVGVAILDRIKYDIFQ
jgi:hypothetical protein